MKHLITTILLLLALLLPATSLAHDFEVDGIYYNIFHNEVEVTYLGNDYGYPDGYSGDVVIPATVTYNDTTYSVTHIGIYAFSDCSELTSVTIPNSVTYIGYQAFSSCIKLKNITIPNSVTEINEYAFWGCTSLTSLNIGSSVSLIGECAFSCCPAVTSITVASDNPNIDSRNDCNAIISKYSNELIAGCQNTIIPNSVTGIWNYAFYGCTRLTSIDIPNSVSSIGWHAFEDCTKLTGITIPNSVTEIYGNAFSGCSALTSIDIPESITFISDHVFDKCSELNDVYCYITDLSQVSMEHQAFYFSKWSTLHVPLGTAAAYQADENWSGYFDTIVEMDPSFEIDGIFYDIINESEVEVTSSPNTNSYLGNITIPTTVIYNGNTYSIIRIANQAFHNCSRLTSINIPNSVTSIGNYAFSGCSKLTNINIPNSVTTIGNYALFNCTELSNIAVAYDNPNIDSRNDCNAIIETITNKLIIGCKNTIIPKSVTSIGDNAFYGCVGLTSINIPNSVTHIGYNTFAECFDLKNVYSYIIDLSQVSTAYNAFTASAHNYSDRTLHVPNGTLAAYQANSKWSSYFGIIIEMDPSFVVDGIYYNAMNDSEVEVASSPSSNPYSGDIIIPSTVANDGTSYKVTSIGERAFADCTGLSSITIPSSVTAIGRQAFMNDAAIETVTCKATTPPTWNGLDLFPTNVYNHTPLVVPNGCARAYMTDQCWGQFAKIVCPGDMNMDGTVSISDVTTLINSLLSGSIASPTADTNGDGKVTISDVTTLINLLLTNH